MAETIKNVPKGAEESVKQLAMVAIERFLIKPLQPAEADVKTFQDSVDAILVANTMPKKYEKVVEEAEVEVVKE